MSRELLTSQKKEEGLALDPRTKLALLLTIAIFLLGGSYMTMLHYLLAAIPGILFADAKMWKKVIIYVLVFGGSVGLQWLVLQYLSGLLRYVIMIIAGLVIHFAPGIAMGYFVVITTTVSEFIAAMEKIRIPKQVTIPMSVMFRFFPTVMEEWSAINDAMRMRGIRMRGGKAGAMLEYRLIPMMMCSVKIGEDLSASALTRGLGSPVKRTNTYKIEFCIQDVVLLLFCLSIFVIQIQAWIVKGV